MAKLQDKFFNRVIEGKLEAKEEIEGVVSKDAPQMTASEFSEGLSLVVADKDGNLRKIPFGDAGSEMLLGFANISNKMEACTVLETGDNPDYVVALNEAYEPCVVNFPSAGGGTQLYKHNLVSVDGYGVYNIITNSNELTDTSSIVGFSVTSVGSSISDLTDPLQVIRIEYLYTFALHLNIIYQNPTDKSIKNTLINVTHFTDTVTTL